MRWGRPEVWRRCGLAVTLLAMAVGCGCGASADGEATGTPPHSLDAAEAKQLLSTLPYRYRWRKVKPPEGATGAVAGTAVGKHRTVLHFGVALGADPEPVPVPGSGTVSAYGYPRGEFVFTDDVITRDGIGKQITNEAQWREANLMVVEMEEKLCKAVTGEPCPA